MFLLKRKSEKRFLPQFNNKEGSKVNRKINKRRILVFLFLLFSFYLFSVSLKQIAQTRGIQRQVETLERKAAAYEKENELLRQELNMLQKHEYIELLARRHLGMVRPGEIVFWME